MAMSPRSGFEVSWSRGRVSEIYGKEGLSGTCGHGTGVLVDREVLVLGAAMVVDRHLDAVPLHGNAQTA